MGIAVQLNIDYMSIIKNYAKIIQRKLFYGCSSYSFQWSSTATRGYQISRQSDALRFVGIMINGSHFMV